MEMDVTNDVDIDDAAAMKDARDIIPQPVAAAANMGFDEVRGEAGEAHMSGPDHAMTADEPVAIVANMDIDEVGGEAHVSESDKEATADFLLPSDELGSDRESPTTLSSPDPSRLMPIEVLLRPPLDPDSYEKVILPPSWVVVRVLDEIDAGGDPWYSVEFDDGRIDQLAYDDLRLQRNGQLAMDRFSYRQRFGSQQSNMARAGQKRRREDLESDDSDDSAVSDTTPMPLRRSTRQKTASRQPSVDDQIKYADEDDVVGNGPSEGDSDDEFQKPERGLGPNRRTTRARNSVGKSYTYPQPSSEDELANDSDGNFKPITSDVVKTRSSNRKKKGRGRPSQISNRNDRDSSIEFEYTRKSGRARQTANYVVPDIDDDFERTEEKVASMPKHVSIKEIFPRLPNDSEFVEIHMTTCETCGSGAHAAKGPLIYCQGCSFSYHKVCLGQRSVRDHRVTKVGPDHFVLQCRICIGIHQNRDVRAPNHAICQTCKSEGSSCAEFSAKKTPKMEEQLRQENDGEDPVTHLEPGLVNNPDGLLFRCTACKRGYHYEHLPPMTQDDEIPIDLRAKRLEEYSSESWRCKECVHSGYKIHALVAWRPVDQESYVTGTTCLDSYEDAMQYLVKWDGRSHFHDTWMPGAWVFGIAASTMRSAFNKKEENLRPKMTASEAVDEEWLLADVFLDVKSRRHIGSSNKDKDLARLPEVTEVFVKFQGLSYAEAVWDEPPPENSGAPWDAYCAAYRDYVEGRHFPHVPDHKMKERIEQYRDLDFAAEGELKEQPDSLKHGKLMEYQLEGVNWLLFNFHKAQNVILADEMGLGKTVQVVALITTLVHDKPNCWPFLIVVPNSTCPNWRRELKHWAPDLRVVTYHGGRVAQELAFRNELFPDGVKSGMKAHVVIMSYEAAVEAKSHFRSVKWAGLVVDEGQRLKNDQSLLYVALQEMRIPFRLLLTGTPLQNNKRELFNLLQFIDPIHNAAFLDEKYAEITKENIPELHKLIRPYFLRRTKIQVLKFLPPMAQIIVPVTMTFLQEKLSKSIMAKNPELIKAIVSKGRVKAGERRGLNNILMELRQCLCHPFLFSDSVEDRSIVDPVKIHQNLVEASGKLMLLNIMLPKLKARGHRVLIFSQFLMSLTILEDFLTAIGLQYARIDGMLSALEKQKRIDAFNAPDSPLFAMLLSTRAGGVGINLASADTVIIFDPDFNPHQDIQALSRSHRIGQKDKVLCFQLTTKQTVEEKIMQIGRKKMALDHALIESMDARDDAGDDLESILKHGADALFSDDARDKIVYDEASVDKLLDRSHMESTDAGNDQSAESQFSFARVWANAEGTLTANTDEGSRDDEAPAKSSVWENILKQREEDHERELAAQRQEYGRGARRRKQDVRYANVGGFIEGVNDVLTENQPPVRGDLDADASSDNDDEFDGKSASEDSAIEEEYLSDVARGKGQKADVTEGGSLRLLNKPPSVPTQTTEPQPKMVVPQPQLPQLPRRRGRPRKIRPEESQNPSQPAPKPKMSRPPTQAKPKPQMNQQVPARLPAMPASNPVIPTQQATAFLPTAPQQIRTFHPPNQTRSTPALPPNPLVANPNYTGIPGAQQHQTQMDSFAGLPNGTQYQAMNRTSYALNQRQPEVSFLHPGLTLKSNNGGASQVKATATSQVRKGTICVVCSEVHPSLSCVDLKSEVSIRVAIDNLRMSKAEPSAKEMVKAQLRQQLRSLGT